MQVGWRWVSSECRMWARVPSSTPWKGLRLVTSEQSQGSHGKTNTLLFNEIWRYAVTVTDQPPLSPQSLSSCSPGLQAAPHWFTWSLFFKGEGKRRDDRGHNFEPSAKDNANAPIRNPRLQRHWGIPGSHCHQVRANQERRSAQPRSCRAENYSWLAYVSNIIFDCARLL